MPTATDNLRAEAAIQKIAGVSPWSDRVRSDIKLVAAHQSSVLITGPSGTGKDLIARAIHANGNRAGKPFIPVDCAVTTGTLFASHMFGHVKGSFTGASSSTLGCFRAAENGTIFLDEIGEMELELQAKLLRVLQQRVVVPVGSHQEIPVDVRVLAATNRDLTREVKEGRFREDLFYRLNVVAIRTMSLKDRPEDVPVLASRYLGELAARHGMPLCSLSVDALNVLQQYSWPGNVRELANLIERLAIIYPGAQVDVDDLPEKFKVNRVDNAEQMQIEEPVHENQHFAETIKVTAMIVENATQTTYEEMQALMAPREIDEFDNITQLPEEGIDLKEYLNTLELNLIRQNQGLYSHYFTWENECLTLDEIYDKLI